MALFQSKSSQLTARPTTGADNRDRFEAIYSQELETGKAWAYKEMLRDLW